jgi:hypothetical protein
VFSFRYGLKYYCDELLLQRVNSNSSFKTCERFTLSCIFITSVKFTATLADQTGLLGNVTSSLSHARIHVSFITNPVIFKPHSYCLKLLLLLPVHYIQACFSTYRHVTMGITYILCVVFSESSWWPCILEACNSSCNGVKRLLEIYSVLRLTEERSWCKLKGGEIASSHAKWLVERNIHMLEVRVCRPRWSSGYCACHRTQGSRVHTRLGTMDF